MWSFKKHILKSAEDQAAPTCPDRAIVIQVCNENSITDDNFDVFLNGTYIGALDLQQNGVQQGSVMIATTNTNLNVLVADFACPLNLMQTYRFDPNLLLFGNNTLQMVNTQANNRGNQGTVSIRNYEVVDNDLINPCVVADLIYIGANGANFTLNFVYTACCPGELDETIIAFKDTYTVPFNTGLSGENILVNDALNGNSVTISNVTINQVLTTNPLVQINETTGEITATTATPVGTHTLVYEICEIGNLTNCDQTTIKVVVTEEEVACLDCVAHDVTIGTQVWTGCNLDVTTYANGDLIPEVTDPTEWNNLTTGAWCYYDNDPANEATYGKLYNWYAVTDTRGLAPTGYHIPTDTEWTTLTDYLGGEGEAGGKMKEVGLCHWNTPNAEATNSSGFTGLPGGYRFSNGVNSPNASFNQIGGFGNWWSSSEVGTTNAWYRGLFYNDGDAYRSNTRSTFGFSVRLILDNTSPEAGITLSVSNDSASQACALYGDPGSEVYYYADDIWYIATGLYQNINDALFAPGEFWYSDGQYARLWNGAEFVGSPVECTPLVFIPITLGFFADNSLEACERFTTNPVTKYIIEGNVDFFNTLELYEVDGTYSPPGRYSDGTFYRTWNGIIFTAPEGNCNL